MKKVLIAAGAALCVAAAAVLVVPSFIDWNGWKPEISRLVREATGYELAIEGRVDGGLLPSPHLRAAGLRIAGPPGASAPDLLGVKELEIALAWTPLLAGRLEVARLRLREPDLRLEDAGDERRARPPPGESMGSLRLDDIAVENGRVQWRNPRSGNVETIERLNARLSAATLAGPWRGSGEAAFGGFTLAFDLALGSRAAGPAMPVTLGLELRPKLARLQVRATLEGPERRIRGRVQLDGGSLLAALDHLGGGALGLAVRPPWVGLLGQPFSLTGVLASDGVSLALNDVALRVGEIGAAGAVSLSFGATTAIDLSLAVGRLDVDRLIAAAPVEVAPPGRASASGIDWRLPLGLDATIDLAIDALALAGGVVRKVRINAALSHGDLIVNQASAELPGSTDATLFGQVSFAPGPLRLEGGIEIASDNLRGLAAWLGIEIAGVPADRLRRFVGLARIGGPLSRLEIAGVDIRLDNSRLTGGITLALGPRLAFGADFQLDRLNLDAYRAADPPAAQGAADLGLAWPRVDGFDGQLRLRLGSLTWSGIPAEGVMLDATVYQGVLSLRELAIRDLAGASVQASGRLEGPGAAANLVLDVSVRAPDANRVLRGLGLAPAPGLGPLAFAGRIEGGFSDELALAPFILKLGRAEFGGSARIHLAGPRPKLVLDLSGAEVPLDALLAGLADGGRDRAAAGAAPPASPATGRWPRERLDLSALRFLDAELGVAGATLSAGKIRLDGAKVQARLADGILDVTELTGTLYRGRFALTGRVDARDRPRFIVNSTLVGAELRQALAALAGIEVVEGRGDLVLSLSAAGDSAAELVASLTGEGRIAARDGTIAGYDLPAMSERLKRVDRPTDIIALVRLGLARGRTPFQALDGRFGIENGVARTEDLRLLASAGEVRTQGAIDLKGWTIDLVSQFLLSEHPDLPSVGLKLSGAIDEPRRVFDVERLQAQLLKRGPPPAPGETPTQP
ncbi:MAG: AsmA family protein [Pseudomonadota bacterium]